MNDVLTSKRKFRTLNIMDDYNRQAIAVEAGHSMPAASVTRILEQVIREQGKPSVIRIRPTNPIYESPAIFLKFCG